MTWFGFPRPYTINFGSLFNGFAPPKLPSFYDDKDSPMATNDWTLQEQLTAISNTLDQFGAEPGELPHERLIKLAVKLAMRTDVPWEYRITEQQADRIEELIPQPPEGKGWELLASSVSQAESTLGIDYTAFFTWERK